MNSLISLRRATKNDLKFLELLYNDKTIQDISLNVDSGKITEKEINNTLEYFEKNKLDFFIVLERKQPIGITLIYEINKVEDYVLIGIALVEKYRGKNIAGEIINILSYHVKEKYKIMNLAGEVYSNNKVSLKLVEKLKFKKNDRKTEIIELNNKKIYMYIYYKNIHSRLLTKIPKYQASIDVMVFFFKKNKP